MELCQLCVYLDTTFSQWLIFIIKKQCINSLGDTITLGKLLSVLVNPFSSTVILWKIAATDSSVCTKQQN